MRVALLCGALLLLACRAGAQECTSPPVTYRDHWCVVVKEVAALPDDGGKRSTIQDLIELQGGNLGAFLLYAQARATSGDDVRQIEDARIDKQVGSPANAPGSTSAVSKGAVPAVLGFAVENGALTQAISGTAVTFRGNLVGWLDLIQNQGFIAAYQDDSRIVRQLRRVSYSFTLNTDTTASVDTSSGPGGFSPGALREQLRNAAQQLTGYSVRVAIWDQRDPRAAVNREAVATMADTRGVAFLESLSFLDPALNTREYSVKWIEETAALLAAPELAERDIEEILYQRLEVMRLFMTDRIANFDEQVTNALTALAGFEQARVKTFQAMQKRPLVAVEYVAARDPELPTLATVRVIAEGQWGPRLDLTANVAWTFQRAASVDTPEPEALEGGLRDFQAAAQVDVPLMSARRALRSASGIGAPVLGVAYLSQKLSETSAVSFGGHSFTLEPGWIHVVQARLTIPVKGSGLKIPLSVSLANRSDLIKEKTVRGHIGLTFDLDVLSALRR